MRLLFISTLLLVPFFLNAATYRAIASGDWSDNSIWDVAPFDGLGGDGVPGASDIALTNGFQIGLNALDGDVTVARITINGSVANSIFYNDPFFTFIPVTLTITTSLSSSVSPTAVAIENTSQLSIVIQGTGTSVINNWSTSAPFNNITFDSGGSTTINSNIAIDNSLSVISGTTLIVGSTRSFTDFSGNASITVPSGAILTVNGAINGDGSTSSFFNSVIINGVVTTGTAGYINSTSFTLGSGATFTVNFNGSNQTEGWWYQSNAPSTVNLDPSSTVAYSVAAAQSIGATNYGGLTVSGGATKTLSSSGTLDVDGNLIIGSSTTFDGSGNSNPIDIAGNVDNNGSWTPAGQVIFDGTSAQVIQGNNIITFGGGIRVENAAGLSLLNIGTDVDGLFDIDIGASFSPSDQVVNAAANMQIDGTLSAGTDPSGFVFDGTTSFLGSGSRSFNDFTVTGTVTAPSGTLTIGGDFTDNGTFNSNSGTVAFGGAQAQSILGSVSTSFENINITNTTNTVSVGSSKNLVGILTLSANSSFNAGGNLTLVSDVDGDATVAEIPASATFSGDVIYQRYIGLSTARWANIGMPIPTSVADITTGGFTTTGSIYTYDETVTGDVDQGWVEETTTLADNSGYSLYLYNGESPSTFSTTGALNTGNVSIPVTYTNTGDASADGWNYVNNPYASSIDWGDADWTKTNINANCAVWNGSTYSYFSSGLISSGQGFWVQTNAASPSLSAAQGVKSNSAQALQKISEENLLKVVITNGTDTDLAKIRFRSDATEEFDTQYDARKLVNAIHNVSTLSLGGINLAINTIPESSCERTIDLKLNQADGGYQLYLEGLGTLSAGYTVQLIDNFEETIIDLLPSTVYNFTVDETDPLTFGEDRFDLVFKSITLDDTIEPNYSINDDCGNNDVVITLSNLQDGVNYYLINSKGDVVSDEQVASLGYAEISINKSMFNADLLYKFTLIGTTDNECSGSLIYTDLVDFEYASIPEITNVESVDVCKGYNGTITLKAEGAPDFGSYRWYLDATTSDPIPGATLSYLVIEDISNANDSYYVSAINENGCEGSRVEIKINTFELTEPTVENASTCVGGSVILKASGALSDEYYRWYTSMETQLPLEDANSSTFIVEGLENTKSYYVAIVNNDGCESNRVEVIAEVLEFEAPELIVTGNILSVPTGFTYQWYLNNEPIQGAVSNSVEVTSSGIYYVEVSNGICTSTSDSRQLVITGIDDVLFKLGLNVYPNPVSDKLFLKHSNNSFSFKLFDLKGNIILDHDFLVNKGEISYFDLSNLKSAFYILNVELDNGIVVPLRILKK